MVSRIFDREGCGVIFAAFLAAVSCWPGNGGGEADFSAALLTIRLWQVRSKSQFLSLLKKQAEAKQKQRQNAGVLRCAQNDKHKWIRLQTQGMQW
jgi:hypothetical protein